MNKTNLSELWAIARQYGRVSLHTSEDGQYWASITFNTIKHTELKARPDGYCDTPEAALISAIDSARNIAGDIKKIQ